MRVCLRKARGAACPAGRDGTVPLCGNRSALRRGEVRFETVALYSGRCGDVHKEKFNTEQLVHNFYWKLRDIFLKRVENGLSSSSLSLADLNSFRSFFLICSLAFFLDVLSVDPNAWTSSTFCE